MSSSSTPAVSPSATQLMVLTRMKYTFREGPPALAESPVFRQVTVNADHIICLDRTSDDQHAVLMLSSGITLTVMESYDAVSAMINP